LSRVPRESDEGATEINPRGTLAKMIASDAFDGAVSQFAQSLAATPEKEAGSIISYAQRQTDFLDTPAMRTALSESVETEQIDFSEWWRGVMSCYLGIPADKLEGSG
jgi:type IV secretion system protein VirD4